MTIRKTLPKDLDAVMAIYATARKAMKANGNPHQWGDHHPPLALIEDDIRKGISYVLEGTDGKPHAVFALILGNDPTYDHIEDGQWLNDKPYGTLHRIASDGQLRGVGRTCFDYCKTILEELRCDTHGANKAMQQILEQNGFVRCGTIYVEDGTPRIAYQHTRKTDTL